MRKIFFVITLLSTYMLGNYLTHAEEPKKEENQPIVTELYSPVFGYLVIDENTPSIKEGAPPSVSSAPSGIKSPNNNIESLSVFGKFAQPISTASNYQLVTYSILKVDRNNLYRKKIQYEEFYRGLYTNFPEYFIRSGYRPTYYYCLIVGDLYMPVLIKRSDEVVNIIGNHLRGGAKIRVYGELKKFTVGPSTAGAPDYYIECDHFTVLRLRPQEGETLLPLQAESVTPVVKEEKEKTQVIKINSPPGRPHVKPHK